VAADNLDEQLGEAIGRGDLEGVKIAVEQGADVNAKDEWSNTPLDEDEEQSKKLL